MISFKELGQMGRLGNQLFQIAATVAFAVRHDDNYIFPLWSQEKYFNLHGCFSNSIHSNIETYKEPAFNYSAIPYKGSINLSGYFQSEKYFLDQRDLIRNLLTPTIGFEIKYDHTSIHVRRGDYVNLTKEYVQLGMEYYNRGMQLTNTSKYIVF